MGMVASHSCLTGLLVWLGKSWEMPLMCPSRVEEKPQCLSFFSFFLASLNRIHLFRRHHFFNWLQATTHLNISVKLCCSPKGYQRAMVSIVLLSYVPVTSWHSWLTGCLAMKMMLVFCQCSCILAANMSHDWSFWVKGCLNQRKAGTESHVKSRFVMFNLFLQCGWRLCVSLRIISRRIAACVLQYVSVFTVMGWSVGFNGHFPGMHSDQLFGASST